MWNMTQQFKVWDLIQSKVWNVIQQFRVWFNSKCEIWLNSSKCEIWLNCETVLVKPDNCETDCESGQPYNCVIVKTCNCETVIVKPCNCETKLWNCVTVKPNCETVLRNCEPGNCETVWLWNQTVKLWLWIANSVCAERDHTYHSPMQGLHEEKAHTTVYTWGEDIYCSGEKTYCVCEECEQTRCNIARKRVLAAVGKDWRLWKCLVWPPTVPASAREILLVSPTGRISECFNIPTPTDKQTDKSYGKSRYYVRCGLGERKRPRWNKTASAEK